AEVGRVDDVGEHRPRLGVLEDAPVDRPDGGRRDDEDVPLEVGVLVPLAPPPDRQALELRLDLRGDDCDDPSAVEQALRLLQADLPAADDEAAPAVQIEACEVVALLVGHVLTLATRAPWRSSRRETLSSPAASDSANAPGPTAVSSTEPSFRPSSARSAAVTSRALSVSSAPRGSRR